MTMRHGGKLLVECLEVLGARHGFGVPGESYLSVLDGMYQSGMTFVNCRNEGGAGFMADAPVARLFRDAKLMEIGAGTSEIRRMLIGRELMASMV